MNRRVLSVVGDFAGGTWRRNRTKILDSSVAARGQGLWLVIGLDNVVKHSARYSDKKIEKKELAIQGTRSNRIGGYIPRNSNIRLQPKSDFRLLLKSERHI